MNLKQEIDGTISATFLPKELPALVSAVKIAEETRLAGLKQDAKDNIKSANQATDLLNQLPND